jgi:serine/threonine protein kinase
MSIDIEIPRYTLIRELGSGGMAVVYLATQEGLDREVAVKVLKKSLSKGSEEFKRRFEHEGRMLAQLEHENIVKIYDIGSTENSVYMVMEYLRGGTLTQKMQSGGLPLQDIIKICAQIGFALHYAHRKNIIHRDLKPSNIMFRDAVTPVLTDFGIARKIDMDMTLTETGMMIGTPQYMSPEQLQGKKVDARSDIYSLGLLFYRLLTGNLPFQGTDPITLAVQQIQEAPEPLPEELGELQPVLDLMLAKDPEDRYPSTLDFCNHLRSISLTGEEYSTQISAATRVFSADAFKDVASYPSGATARESVTAASSVSKAFSSIGTAVSTVITRRKPRYIALAAVLIAAVGIYLATRFLSHGLSEQQLAAIESELDNFNAFVVLEQIYEQPDGRNATDSLEKLMEMAPEYEEVLNAADELASRYANDAWAFYDNREWDEALALIDKGLTFAPENEQLLELSDKVGSRIAARDLQLKINDLLEQGNLALAANLLLPGDGGPDGVSAYDAFKQVRELSLPGTNLEAEQGLSTIQTRLAERAQEAWDTAGRDEAKALAQRGLEYFTTSQTLISLTESIEREEAFEQEQREFEALLAQAQEQLGQGRLVEPAGDNALASLSRARELRPADPAVISGLEQIADHYLEIARSSLAADELSASLQAAANGLKALPDDPELLTVQGSATARLDATNQAIQIELQAAKRMAAEGRFIAGQSGMEDDADHALAAFNRVLILDPDNPDARSGLDSLPGQIAAAAASLQREGQLDQARQLLMAANLQYPDQARWATGVARLNALIDERETRQRLAEQVGTLDELIAARPLTTESIDRIAAALRDTRSQFPDAIAVTQRSNTFIETIAGEAERISRDGSDPQALALLDHSLLLYPGSESLQDARRGVEQRQLDRAEQARRELLARSGVLAIDATPWARVLDIRDSEQQSLDLPPATETPFMMSLEEGDYTVVLAAADTGERVELPARVTRQEVERLRFDDALMTAQDYFEKSGW